MNALDYLRHRDRFLRLLIYGHAKTKKTWWACAAAEAGFNVFLLDMDRGAAIIRNLSERALQRTHVVTCADRGDDPVAYQFIRQFAKTYDCFYHAERAATSTRPIAGSFNYDFKRTDPSTVIILDSWSALCRSLIQHFSNTHKVDPADAGKIEWEGYRWVGMMATWVLDMLKSIPCHLIVIGHQATYEKYTVGRGNQRKLMFTREQPLSTSNPHGQTLASHFDEVYRFYTRQKTTYIATDGHEHCDGGSRIVPPGQYRWEELTFAKLCSLHNITPPGFDTPPREYPAVPAAPAGQLPARHREREHSKQEQPPVIQPPQQQKQNPLASLLMKNNGGAA